MATPPSIPQIRSIPLASLSTLEFWWQAPRIDGNAPIVSYSLLCSSISYSTIIGPSSFYAMVSPLINGNDYEFQLAATNTAGTSSYVPFKSSQPGILAAGVTSISVTEETNTMVNVAWSINNNLNESIIRSFVITGTPSDLSISSVRLAAYPNQRNIIVDNISYSMPYTFYAQAVNDAGWSYPNVSSIITTSPPPPPVPDPLMDLNALSYSGSGTWYDDTENGYNATIETGIIGLNAANNGIVLNGSSNWTFPNVGVANSWSLAVWYKQTAAPSLTENACIITQIYANGANNMTLLRGGQGQFFNGNPAYGTPVTLVNGVWTNIMVPWNGANMTTYINGSSIGTTSSIVTAVDSGQSYRIGRMWNSPQYVTGEIGRVTVWSQPLLAVHALSYYSNSYNNY